MKFSALWTLLAARYEHLFVRRFRLENECANDRLDNQDSTRRRRFSVPGAIFPTESMLPRYQY